MAASGPQSTM